MYRVDSKTLAILYLWLMEFLPTLVLIAELLKVPTMIACSAPSPRLIPGCAL